MVEGTVFCCCICLVIAGDVAVTWYPVDVCGDALLMKTFDVVVAV